MDVHFNEQALLLSASLASGIVMGLFYDVLRLVRILFGESFSYQPNSISLPLLQGEKTGLFFYPIKKREGKGKKIFFDILLFFLDILFFAFSALSVSLVFYNFGGGRFRLYGVLASFLSFIIYLATAGKAVLRIICYIYYLFSVFLLYVRYIVFLPLRLLIRLWIKPSIAKEKERIRERKTERERKKAEEAARRRIEDIKRRARQFNSDACIKYENKSANLQNNKIIKNKNANKKANKNKDKRKRNGNKTFS